MYASEKASSSVGRSLCLKGAGTDNEPWFRTASNLRKVRHMWEDQAEAKKGERKMVAGKTQVANSRHRTDTEGRTEIRRKPMPNYLVRRTGGVRFRPGSKIENGESQTLSLLTFKP